MAATPVPEALPSVPDRADIEPVAHEKLDRTMTGLVTGLPVAGLAVAVWQAWDGLLRPSDLVVFAIVYVLTGLGVTVGFHRLLTHRSFKAGPSCAGRSEAQLPARIARARTTAGLPNRTLKR